MKPGINSSPEVLDFISKNPDNSLFSVTSAFAHDTRDSLLYPTSGKNFRVSAEVTAPGSDLEYYRLNLESSYYYPFTRKAALKLSADIGYGDGYGYVYAYCYECWHAYCCDDWWVYGYAYGYGYGYAYDYDEFDAYGC